MNPAQIEFGGEKYYVDDLTRALSKKHDFKAYSGLVCGVDNNEYAAKAMGKLCRIAGCVGQVVGVTLEQYGDMIPDEEAIKQKEDWMKLPEGFRKVSDAHTKRCLRDTGSIILYHAGEASKCLGTDVLRTVKFNGQTYYVPTETLLENCLLLNKNMLKEEVKQ